MKITNLKLLSAAAAVLFLLGGLGVIASVAGSAQADPNSGNTHPETVIQIAPGMTYTWTPIWTSGLNTTTSIYSEKLNDQNVTVPYAEVGSGGKVTVTIDPNTVAGDVYKLMIKGSSTNPAQEYYVPIKFNITANLDASVSQHPNIVTGASITLNPSATGMGTITWSFTSGKPTVTGLSINSTTGKVTGTPQGMDTITVYITATSSIGEKVDLVTTFTIVPKLVVTNDPTSGAIAYALE